MTNSSKNTPHRTSRTCPSTSAITPAQSNLRLDITYEAPSALRFAERNPRKHPERQMECLMKGIRAFGFLIPVLVDADLSIIAGHARVEAARHLSLEKVPVVQVDHLSAEEIRIFRIADNRIAELSSWDDEILRFEIGDLVSLELSGAFDFDLDLTGFGTAEIDVLLDGTVDPTAPAETVELPDAAAVAVTALGDVWILGGHRLICGNALDAAVHATLMGQERARMLFTDPPYNVKIVGHVRTQRDKGHREFEMGVGEMSKEAFQSFLAGSIAASRVGCVDGAILMICMDWRHLSDLNAAAWREGLDQINLCVWSKTNGGMGSLYRSQHELVVVFKTGTAPHVNNVQLGRFGRYRTNVWSYAGVNTFRKGRAADLADHPTVKPTALVADAIRDVSHRGEIVLDPFGGSGTTLLAAEKTGRRARLIELDPLYVDVTIRRWEAMTGKKAVHEATGEAFGPRSACAMQQPPDAADAGEAGRQKMSDACEVHHG